MKGRIRNLPLFLVLLFLTIVSFTKVYDIEAWAATGGDVTVIREDEEGNILQTQVISNRDIGNDYWSTGKPRRDKAEDGTVYHFEKDNVKYLYIGTAPDSAPGAGKVTAEPQTVRYIYGKLDEARTIRVHRNLPGETGGNEVVVVKLPKTAPTKGVSPFTNTRDSQNRVVRDKEFETYNSADWYGYFWDKYTTLSDTEKAAYRSQDAYANRNHADWNGRGSGFFALITGRLVRTFAYNTQPDGSGTYYKTGTPLPADAPDELDLYIMSVRGDDMSALVEEVQRVKPVIYLENNPDHLSVETAYNVDKSGSIHYKAKLDFTNIRNAMRVLWGRSDKIVSWKGYVKPVIDNRLQFDREVEIAFESTWQRLDPDRQAELGATNIRYEGTRTVFTFTTERMNQFRNANGDYEINIPVTLVPKKDFVDLSFEDFMKPMWISVADNFEQGLNAIITDQSYLEIATSRNPVIVVGGQINLEIEGETGAFGGIQHYTNGDPKADDVYARLFPFGKLDVDFYEVQTGANGNLNEITRLTSPINEKGETENKVSWNYLGRSKHFRYTAEDEKNYANSFFMTDSKDAVPANLEGNNIKEPTNITHPEIDGYTFIKMKDVDENGDEITGFDTFDYTFDHESVPEEGFTSEIQINPKHRRLYYIKNSSIIVRHITVDPNGNEVEIADREYYSDDIGKNYTTNSKDNITYNSSDYKYIKTAEYTDPVNGEYKDGIQTITYVYSLGGSVVARYVIQDTDTELLDAEGMPSAKIVKEDNSNIGDTYTIPGDVANVPEYLYDAEGNIYKYSKDREDTKTFGGEPVFPRSGEVDVERKTVVFEYLPVYGDVIVHYVDEAGNTIHNDTINTDLTQVKKDGPSYNTLLDAYSSINYNGKVYKFKTVDPADEEKQNGVLEEGRIEVTYIYTLDKDMDVDVKKSISRFDGSNEGIRLGLNDEDEVFTYKISTPLPKELNASTFEFSDVLSRALTLKNVRIKFLATGSEASATTPSSFISLATNSNATPSNASPSNAEEISVLAENIPMDTFLELDEVKDLVEASINRNEVNLKITDKAFLDSIKDGSIVVALDAVVFYPNYHSNNLPDGIPNVASVKIDGRAHITNIVYVDPFVSAISKNTPNGGGGRSSGGGNVVPSQPGRNNNPVGPTVPSQETPGESQANTNVGDDVRRESDERVQNNGSSRILRRVPKTGDSNNIILLFGIFGIAILSMFTLVVKKNRK